MAIIIYIDGQCMHITELGYIIITAILYACLFASLQLFMHAAMLVSAEQLRIL